MISICHTYMVVYAMGSLYTPYLRTIKRERREEKNTKIRHQKTEESTRPGPTGPDRQIRHLSRHLPCSDKACIGRGNVMK
jgi:hypothetical protein